jgi:hypothetical protein
MAIYTASFAAWANEPLYRKTQVQAIRHAFVAKKFDHLESLHQRYLQNGTRTPSGIWELSLLHEGLQLPITNKAGTPIQDGSEFDRHFDEWLTAHPRSEVAHLARVQRYIARFEDILRSVGNATPTMDQLRLLREQLDNAEIYIARHRPREAKDPHWDVLNLIMANWRGLDRDSFDRMLREALARHPTYYDLYFEAGVYYINHADNALAAVDTLAREGALRTQATDGAGLYARVLWSASRQIGDVNFQRVVNWPLMKRAVADVVARWPDDYNRAFFARFACIMRDKETTAELLQPLREPHISSVWNWEDSYEICRKLAFGESAKKP